MMAGFSSISYLKNQLDRFGWRAMPKLASESIHKIPSKQGQSIWNEDWDLLVILDGCREDWMNTVTDEYSFIQSVDSIWSIGGHSREFIENTFINGPDQEIQNTAYITANHFADDVSNLDFEIFENVNKKSYEGDYPVAPAHVVTDRAITIGRENNINRVVIHYMQPHKPFFHQNNERGDIFMDDWSVDMNLYHSYFNNKVSKQDIHEGYTDNLRYVLDEVSILLNNFDAQNTVITADHGNAVGERFLWDHISGVQHPVIRKVPWIETSAKDNMIIKPSDYADIELDEDEIEKRLTALGYK